jgi:hypothetical protein
MPITQEELAVIQRTPKRAMRVYIAGPMTGIPEFNFPAFDRAAATWLQAGWDVISPADLTRTYWRQHFGEEFDPSNMDPRIAAGGDIYREFLRHDIAEIAHCDAIALLPGWEKSGGVAKELTVARLLGLQELDAITFEPMTPRHETILEEAQRLVHGDRGADYGHPMDDYTRTGRIWGALLGIGDIDPRIACLMMAGVKMSREVNRHKRDNLTDLAGYGECANMIAERQATVLNLPDVRHSGK